MPYQGYYALPHNPNAKLLELLKAEKLIFDDKVFYLDQCGDYLIVVNRAVIKSYNEVLPFMKSDEFDPKTMVILEREAGEQLTTGDATKPMSATCAVLGYDNEVIRIRTSSDQRGFLVLSEIFYPVWQPL